METLESEPIEPIESSDVEELLRSLKAPYDKATHLARLGNDHKDALLRHASSLLATSAEHALDALTAHRPTNVLPMDPHDVIELLRSEAPDLVPDALDRLYASLTDAHHQRHRAPAAAAVAARGGSPHDHAPDDSWRPRHLSFVALELVRRHASRLREIQEIRDRGARQLEQAGAAPGGSGASTGARSEAPAGEVPTLQRRLLDVLPHCAGDDVVAALAELEPPPPVAESWLVPQRALLLSRLRRHEEALRLLSREEREPRADMAYCTSQPDAGASELYPTLLRIYLEEDPPRLSPALALIQACGAHLEPLSVLELLPRSAPISALEPALRKLLCEVQRRRHESQIVCSLRKARSVQVHAQLLEARAQYIKVGDDQVCATCGKRIGVAAFRASATGKMAHIACAFPGI